MQVIKVILLTLLFVMIAYYQTKGLIKNKEWKELAVYLVLMLTGVVYSYGILLDFPLPNPIEALDKVMRPIYKQLNNYLANF
ncbi:hypothetical protein Halha_2558 [Halobacteroides halobius DSM 5150]|uniref:Uncharacterized protein n=1 Tax=Halobacteroides halobius (strain ATCC 35273 / DSM 5150 / MD-1) TaxID=748449 RepID=L0KAW2_HALHC|nr:hypothetical protein [Halobacteroides halobius]AGB42432.1 hypothetical protein Halha_2558 [Halobacteroides halobius DSM 5150]